MRMPDGPAAAARLRRLERGIRRRADLKAASTRVGTSAPAILQIVLAAAAAYSIAHYGFGHAIPVVAVTVTISGLGFARDARPRRVLESVIGILVGIVLADVLTHLVGQGIWQLALILTTTLIVARAVSPSTTFAVAAAVQSTLVVLLPPPEGGVFVRSLDGLIGGVVAILITALIPRDPRREARREGRALFSVLEESTRTIADSLADADTAAGDLALTRLRRTQPMIDRWTVSLDTAVAVARISPLLRRHLPELRVQLRVLTASDLTARHLRLLARRVEFLVRDGRQRPIMAGIVSELATAIHLLGSEIDDREYAGASRSLLTDVAERLDPAKLVPDEGVADSSLVLLMRPLVVDLLVGAGAQPDEARGMLPPF